MSRPSRGFTVTKPQPTSAIACPTDMLLTLVIVDVDNYQYYFTWSPPVTATTLSMYGAVDGSDIGLMYQSADTDTGGFFAFDPAAWGTSGQTLSVYMVASDVAGCPDFQSNTVDTEIP